eukprot:7951812-Alexandrium_andersonii.AAC.1
MSRATLPPGRRRLMPARQRAARSDKRRPAASNDGVAANIESSFQSAAPLTTYRLRPSTRSGGSTAPAASSRN